jgi:hypothetical protein
MARRVSFLLRENTILKIQFELAPSNREIELLIAFFGLPNAIDIPLPLIDIKARGTPIQARFCSRKLIKRLHQTLWREPHNITRHRPS